MNVDELWESAVPARIAGVDVQVMSPEHVLLHLCIHATYTHYCEFSARPWCDLAQTIRTYGESVRWQDIVECATRWRCRRGTYLALRLATDLAGADVPNDVLRCLRPADFDEGILTVAMRQRHRVRLSRHFAPLFSEQKPAATWRAIWSRLFLQKYQLADTYNISRSSRVLCAFYAIRLKDLVKRYWQVVFRLHRGDPALVALARDTAALRKFLAAE